MKTNSVVTVLDIGSSKICCCIAAISASGRVNILGAGYCVCFGVKYGIIIDMESVAKSIVKAIEAAESAAKINVKSVYVSVSGRNVKSKIVGASVYIGGRVIRSEDILQLLSFQNGEDDSSEIIHAIPIMYSIDSMNGIKDPLGMIANNLTASINFVSVPKIQLNNLLLCLGKCHLDPTEVVASSYACGLSASEDDAEIPLSQIVIDFGGETTTISFIYNGIFCGSELIPIGGRHITKDIAYGLNISTASAERLKTLHGAAFVSIEDERDTVLVPVLEDENVIDMQQLPKSTLNGIIQPRIEEIMLAVKQKIDESVFKNDFKNSFVTITGGGSQLTGIRDFAAEILNRNIRIKKISHTYGNANLPISNDFSVTLGMIKFAQLTESVSIRDVLFSESNENKGFFKKTLLWIENNL
ncbi:MAG: cell division protein FtsA [Holosporaceae bacterium]|jgi:cell division protein FtsA|nr:cell division protein FtsA [Holosporaceae bacterium]